jgi:DNA-binding transcriptional regulator YdaS (Cro superfamily)
MTPGLEAALQAVGGSRRELAKRIKRSRQAIYQWTRVPAEAVIAVEKATGVPREKLRPDLYRRAA